MQIKGEINMLMFVAAALGIILALSFDIYIPEAVSPYIAIALIAAFDSILGGITASYDKKFNFMIFITIIASLIALNLIDNKITENENKMYDIIDNNENKEN